MSDDARNRLARADKGALCDELREVAAHSPALYRTTESRASVRSLLTDAADEIERLRAENAELRRYLEEPFPDQHIEGAR